MKVKLSPSKWHLAVTAPDVAPPIASLVAFSSTKPFISTIVHLFILAHE
jgi:hypothetical protein